MADVKISALPGASTPLAGTELLELVQSGISTSVAASAVAASATNVRTVATGGTGAATLTGYVKGNGTAAMTAAATIPVADLTGSITVPNGGTGAATLTGYVKGTGTTAMTASAQIPFNDLAGRAWINASSNVDQTGSVSTATALTFSTGLTGAGISVVAGSQVTFDAAGTYQISHSVQFANSAAADHTVTVWLRKNGTNIVNSASSIVVPKLSDGGSADHSTVWLETVTAGQYIEVMFFVSNVAITAEATVAGAIAPAIPSIVVAVERIA